MYSVRYDLSKTPTIDWIDESGAKVVKHNPSFGEVTLTNDGSLLRVAGTPCILWRAAFQSENDITKLVSDVASAISSQSTPILLGAGVVQSLIENPELLPQNLRWHMGNLAHVGGSQNILIWGTEYETFAGRRGIPSIRLMNGKIIATVKPLDGLARHSASLILI